VLLAPCRSSTHIQFQISVFIMDSINPSLSSFKAQPLAVVGMACRLPGNSNSLSALWDFLERGGIADNVPPPSRFNLRGHEDGTKRLRTMRSPGGMFLENIDPADLDAQFFGLSKAEAIAMDPQQRQLLEVVYEGLENAGITLESLKGQPVGCFVGSYASDWSDIQGRDPEDRVANATVGVGRAMLSNRLSHFLDVKGPSMTIDTACSGSLVGLDVASRYLQTGEINAAIVAGCNLYMSPEHCIDLSTLSGAASLSGRCHTFDSKADGYMKSEAVNMVIVKRLSDAIRDRDPIRGIVRGSSTNSDGWTAGIASPSSEAQAKATRQAYINAGITDLNQTAYVECHGTGTRAGDPIEVNGVASVFCATRPVDQPLLIGSIKSNLGHSEPAAGISGMLKTILALEKGMIPGNPTFLTPNPAIHFDELKVRAFNKTIPWPNMPFRRASVNSFGYGGSNVHVILDEAKTALPSPESIFKSSYMAEEDDPFSDVVREKPHLLVLSANDETSLKAYVDRLRTHLINPQVRVSLSDLAYTLSDRRTRHFHRAFQVSQTSAFNPNALCYGKPGANPPRIGFVFTGQGAQWPQMGKVFVETFPSAKKMLLQLDNVLQSLPDPPNWSLYDEITYSRSPEHIRQPEFSQPLVTALQLVILDILKSWQIEPVAVVGHSSGEIAGSVASGYLTPAQAIQVAYFRGKAAVDIHNESQPRLGMLAVGLGKSSSLLQKIMEDYAGLVFIACVNSPESVTLSGHVSALEKLAKSLEENDCFARLLQVDLAYHSRFMEEISAHYKSLLDRRSLVLSSKHSQVKMFSSVTGGEMGMPADSEYWKANMQSPVLFEQAVHAMMSDEQPPDFLVEIGPSGALAGPFKQIVKALSTKAPRIEYHASCRRHAVVPEDIFNVAGQLFLKGRSIDMSAVNSHAHDRNPSVLVDLPNYAWNHTTKYWFESKTSKDWRFRNYPNHDLLGGKVLGTPWSAPTWKKVLRPSDLTWLLDHRIDGQVLFPAAGYIAMAVEAAFQTLQSQGFIDSSLKVHQAAYRLRNVRFVKALVFKENSEQRVMLMLTPENNRATAWNKFSIVSLHDDDTTTEHCTGFITNEKPNDQVLVATSEILKPFEYPTPAQLWYKAMKDVGYSFGPSFQSQLEIEAVAGSRSNRALISFLDPPSAMPQSPYSIHPAAIDGCLQSGAPSLWQGIRSAVSATFVPAMIDDLVINARQPTVKTGLSVVNAEFSGAGSSDDILRYKSNIHVFDPDSQKLLMKLSGLWYSRLDTEPDLGSKHSFLRLEWKPDHSFLSEEKMRQVCTLSKQSKNQLGSSLWSITDLILHKKPSLAVAEFSALPFSKSVGLELLESELSSTKGDIQYHFIAHDGSSLLASQDAISKLPNVHLHMLDVSNPAPDFSAIPGKLDMVIVRVESFTDRNLASIMTNAKSLLAQNGYLAVISTIGNAANDQMLTPDPSSSSASSSASACSDSDWIVLGDNKPQDIGIFHQHGFARVSSIPRIDESASPSEMTIIAQVTTDVTREVTNSSADIHILHLSDCQKPICSQLAASGLVLTEHSEPYGDIQPGSTVLIVDELYNPILTEVNQSQWEIIKQLTTNNCKVLWVTSGAQMDVTNPQAALVYGMSRVIRAEDPTVSFTLLDVESKTSAQSIQALKDIIISLQNHQIAYDGVEDNEFVERDGILYISRVYPDPVLNIAEQEVGSTSSTELQDLHSHPSCVRLVCEKPGMLQSLQFKEISSSPIPLEHDFVEVEMHATGLNYKDIATSLGIVPENQYLLGLEGAGVICRLGSNVSGFRIGQRVAVNRRGCFANKVQAPIEAIHSIPDWMSFEEAASLPMVYLSVIQSLFNLANIQKGQTVLIHSAAGGVGLAAIQICQYMGAEIFATVGNDDKRKLISENFQIPHDHIFSSRNAEFAPRILELTNGKGVDVILNTLTGNLLDESWRIIAAGGTMIELGKKDILDRNFLSMEPFNRNASYRALDMSHSSITRPITESLMKKLFELVNGHHVKPIEPRTVFPYSDISGAIRYMRGGEHMGKIVVSRKAPSNELKVPVVPAAKDLKLSKDAAYLIVGGLKGLCGSLAVYLARNGAKELTIMSRSGYDDDKSRSVIRDISFLGARCELVQGDVSIKEDVRRAFRQSRKPIAGIIQGAMVLKDKIYTSMSVDSFRDVLACKVEGSWNLHEVSGEFNHKLDFFTLLSSVSGLVGQKGQANYAAAGSFQDSLAAYRRSRGLTACAVDLGVIEDVGYISERKSIADRLDMNIWTPINEPLLHRILQASILEQHSSGRISSNHGKKRKDYDETVVVEGVCKRRKRSDCSQMITGIPFPQPSDAALLHDPRFSTLATGSKGDETGAQAGDTSQDVRALLSLMHGGVDYSEQLSTTIEVVSRHFMRLLGLAEPMESAKPLAVYGLDSLAAVEFRNWMRHELKVTMSTLEVVSAKTLSSLCETIVVRLQPSA
ncbi:PKS-like enzyme, partial [Penicillium herquei]